MCLCVCVHVHACVCASASLGFVSVEETFPRDGKRKREPWAGCLGPESRAGLVPPTGPRLGRTACSSQVPPVEKAQLVSKVFQS